MAYIEMPSPDGVPVMVPERKTRIYRQHRLQQLRANVGKMLNLVLDAGISGNAGRAELAGEGLAEAYTRLKDAEESYRNADKRRGRKPAEQRGGAPRGEGEAGGAAGA